MDLEQWRGYLKGHLEPSSDNISFDRLEGGYLNSTIRLTLNRDVESAGKIPDLKQSDTLILKHYPPYMYAWPDAPLSVTRAKAEADALRMMQVNPHLAQVFQEVDIVTPRVIYFDEDQHVLWMEDLGQQKSLEDFLQPENANLGKRIGTLMASIHLATLTPPKTLPAEPPAGPDAILEHEERMRKLLEAEPDLDELMVRLRMRDAPIIGLPHRDSSTDEICLGIGDIWPSSFLVMDQLDRPRLGLIDWEFWGPMHPAAEIATLVARFYVACLESGSDPSYPLPTHIVDAYLSVSASSGHTGLLGRPSWALRARAAWARVLLNAVHRAKTEEEARTLDAETTDQLLKEALRSLRDQDSNTLLARLCGRPS